MNWTALCFSLMASLMVVLVAAAAAFVFYLRDSALKRWMPRLITLAVGVLLGDAFLHLLPDALSRTDDPGTVFLWTLLGIVFFYIIEQFLHWRHDHAIDFDSSNADTPQTYAKMNLLGDGVHNFVDGILIAGSFLADPVLGLATTVAIILHEIPQELSDIAVLLHGGYTKKRAVILNIYCALACVAGTLFTLVADHFLTLSLSALMAVTAGGFIYIATSDLIPLLRLKEAHLSIPTQIAGIFAGILSMQAILWVEMITRQS
jgi:zinc and cadmium transporter